jgi:HEAT repeat protein
MDFEDYLDELSDPRKRLKASGLARLSALDQSRASSLRSRWPAIDARRRRKIVEQLAELAEDNVEMDFSSVFLQGLEDDHPVIRLACLRGLWEFESPQLIDKTVGLLAEDGDAAVRAEAALSLGRFVLLSEYGRLRPRYFQRVEAALKTAVEDIDEIEEVRARALEAIGAHNAAWVRQAVGDAYESGNLRLKVGAVHAMGRSCEPRWLPLLTKELGSEEPELRYEAAVACGSLGDEAAVKPLARLLLDEDEEVRDAAAAALGEIGGPEAKQALLLMLESSSSATRDAAAAALAEIDFEEDPLGFRHRG